MKGLGATKKILGMEIIRDRSVGKLFLSQQAYVEKVLKRFNMNNAKPVTVSFVAHFKLSADMSSKTDEEMEHMSSVPYSSIVGSIMYAMDTTDVGLTFDRVKMSDSVVGYMDSDFAGDLEKRRSLIENRNFPPSISVDQAIFVASSTSPQHRRLSSIQMRPSKLVGVARVAKKVLR
ncbi:hypothetical protein GH714_008115 [Hevea brasiliensis]|uniref:Reverse transcriptase Ty1/copia-type domain-containing protein n=1 Tax=Hevea brasiliensis TaxID=3981 RepID=A0A6A6N9U5_HEVBR|nr:hypothetical protein GH714_008115 [Hevea brasiliensis]